MADELGAVDFEVAVETVVYYEVVGHADAVRFHGVTLTVVVVADFGTGGAGGEGFRGGNRTC